MRRIFLLLNDKQMCHTSEAGIYGAPDIIIEVLFKANKNADLIKKKAVYEEFGVSEYFIVDPAGRKVIT